jgi:sortase A
LKKFHKPHHLSEKILSQRGFVLWIIIAAFLIGILAGAIAFAAQLSIRGKVASQDIASQNLTVQDLQAEEDPEPDVTAPQTDNSQIDNLAYTFRHIAKQYIPKKGKSIGKIDIDSQNIHMNIKVGTELENLDNNNAAIYSKAAMLGEKGISLIAGHNWPDFGKIYYLNPGDRFTVSSNWGSTYTYVVLKKTVERADSYPIEDKVKDKSNYKAILYSCYPLEALDTPYRTFVEAILVDGDIWD